MAVLINKQINIMGGIILDNLYLRIEYFVNLSGKRINFNVYPYYSKDSFTKSPNENVLRIPEITSSFNVSYTEEFGNILTFIHSVIKKDLINKGFASDEEIVFVDIDN